MPTGKWHSVVRIALSLRMNHWTKIGLALVATWAVAASVIYWARTSRPTAESVTAYLATADLASNRPKVIGRVQSMLNEVPFEDRQRLNRSGATRKFFASLNPSEQAAFLDATLPSGFKQLMESFNKMEPAKRKRIVEGALTEMKKHEGEAPARAVEDDKLAQRVIDQGLRSFYTDANADVKLDLAPLIEQMQHNLRDRGP